MRNRTVTYLSIASIAGGAIPAHPKPPSGGGTMKLFRPLFGDFRDCRHSRTRLILDMNRRTYQVCRRCGRKFDCALTDPAVQSPAPFKVDGFGGEAAVEPLAA